LADPHAITAVYMGKKTFPALAARLIGQGLSPETPALLAESIGQAEQRVVRTTVEKLAEQLANEKVTATAVILYGALAADHP
jgi:uroporphyrin-III C-methyltransferase